MKFYPYKRLNRSIALRVSSVSLKIDDGSRYLLDTSAFSVNERTVALGVDGRADWVSAHIAVSATLPPGSDALDAPWSELRVLAVLTDGETNVRTSTELRRESKDGKDWSGKVELFRDDHVGRASLAVYAVATVDDVPGRSIAESDEEWTVDTVSSEPVRGLSLEVKQVDFRRTTRAWLHSYADIPWVVDASGRLPTVYINTGVEGLTGLLNSRSGGMEKSVHELLVSQMSTDVWTAVFHSAVGDLEIEPDGVPVFPTDWQGEVLREMLPDVVPGVHVEEALRRVHRSRTGDSGWAELQTRIHFAAIRRANVISSLTGMLRGLEKMNQGDDA